MAHVATVTIDYLQVAADLTDFVVLVDLADLPAAFWDVVANGGGDIRCYKSDGTTQIAREVVSCDTATDTGELYIKYSGTLSSSVDTEIQIHADGTSSEPAVTDTYGRNAVSSDYVIFAHLKESAGSACVNSTGGTSGTYGGGLPDKLGIGQDFDGSLDYIDFGPSALGITSALTFQIKAKPDSITGVKQLFTSDNDSISGKERNWQWRINTNDVEFIRFNASDAVIEVVQDLNRISSGATHWIATTFDTTNGTDIYVNGSASGTSSNTTAMQDNGGTDSRSIVGSRYKTGDYTNELMDGELGELRVRSSVLSAEWIETEYNNQSAPSSFYTAVAAGGGTTYNETLDGALTSGGDLSPVLAANLDLSGALATNGDLPPIADFNLPFSGALSSGGDLADSFSAGAVTYNETLDGDLQSGGDLLPVVGYGVGLNGALQSGGDLADAFSGAGLWEEDFSGAITSGGDFGIVYAASAPMNGALATGGDLVPVLSSTITAIGALDSGGDLVVFVAYQQAIDGALQSGGNLADAFTSGTGDYNETLDGALSTGGDLVPVVQWGVLVDGALTVGGDLADVFDAISVEPSLFQSAADTIIDVFSAAHGQTITLALDSGTVTITGFMRKRPKDWSTPDGNMRGSGWQIVCKGWEISSSDLEGMSGKRATVDGNAYYIVSATPKTSGTLVLDVGYANA